MFVLLLCPVKAAALISERMFELLLSPVSEIMFVLLLCPVKSCRSDY